jgi:uncharacterized membrane protein
MNKGFFSFTALSVLIGGLAIIGLLLYGWSTGQSLPLWPALLVVGVNVVLAIKLVLEVKAKRANRPGNPGAHGPR